MTRDTFQKMSYLSYLKKYTSKNPAFSYDEYNRFDLGSIEEPECKYNFRVEKRDIPFLADVLQLPEVFRCNQRTVADRIEGLCMLLMRTERILVATTT